VSSEDSYLSPKLHVRVLSREDEYGVFAHEPVQAGEVLAVFSGSVCTAAELEEKPHWVRYQTLQIEEDLYLWSLQPPDPPDYINHSCEPNAGIRGQIVLCSMRPIAAGEEVTFDYAMAESAPYDHFECDCGTPSCRGRVRGDDWRRPELWERYGGHFSDYLQRRIARLRQQS
jgi:SET domain-containing protein